MLIFIDGFSQFVFAETLRHDLNLIQQNTWLRDRAVGELLQRGSWEVNASGLHVCRLFVNRNDLWPDTALAREFSFGLVTVPTDDHGDIAAPQALARNVDDVKPWLVGAWINHGTLDRPSWSSHT